MNNFQFNNPTKLIFGKETIGQIGKEMAQRGVKKVLYLYGKGSIHKNGVYDLSVKSLNENGIEMIELSGVKPNPTLTKVYEGIDICKNRGIGAVLAVGGGSVIDSAKAIGAGAKYSGGVWDFFCGKARSTKSLPVYVILTLSATGSEMNPYGVITKEDEGKKWAFGGGKESFPVVSIVDPSVQFTLPQSQTVNGAVDTISHVMENYFDGTPQTDFQDEYAEGLIRTVIKHARILLKEPDNYESRAQLALCATMALNGLTAVGRAGGDWATHALEHSVSVFTDVAHGAGLAIMFPAWMKYVYKNDVPKFAKFGRNIFGSDESDDEICALKTIEALKNFFSEIGAPVSLREIGVAEDQLTLFTENASLAAPLGRMMQLESDDINRIYELAF